MNDLLVQGQDIDIKKYAADLREMADRLELNESGQFGGCFVIIPPLGGEVLKTLILDNRQDPAQFYAFLKTKAEMAIDGLQNLMNNQGAFRR